MAVAPQLARSEAAETTRDLYERYSVPIFRYCLSQLDSREEAEDALQSTFLNAFRGLKRGTRPASETAWLYKIAQNICLTRRRSALRRGRVETPQDIDLFEAIVPAPAPAGVDELIALGEALESMPDSQRRAILLREWQGLSYREIGEQMGLSQAAVETLIFRARRSLAERLEQPARPRIRHALDLGWLVTALKGLLGAGAAAKAVATATVAATAVALTAGSVPEAAEPEPAPKPKPAAAAPRASLAAPDRVRSTVARAVVAAPARAKPRTIAVPSSPRRAAPSTRATRVTAPARGTKRLVPSSSARSGAKAATPATAPEAPTLQPPAKEPKKTEPKPKQERDKTSPAAAEEPQQDRPAKPVSSAAPPAEEASAAADAPVRGNRGRSDDAQEPGSNKPDVPAGAARAELPAAATGLSPAATPADTADAAAAAPAAPLADLEQGGSKDKEKDKDPKP